MIVAKRCFVSGRVQGVFYRASAQQEANRLGVRGYAKNLADGRVEVLAVGEEARVAAFVAWLWRGSPAADVADVEVAQCSADELGPIPERFTTR